jgi:hypothetical protein
VTSKGKSDCPFRAKTGLRGLEAGTVFSFPVWKIVAIHLQGSVRALGNEGIQQ